MNAEQKQRVVESSSLIYHGDGTYTLEPVGYLYTNVQSGEYHVSDYDDDYRGPERALWCIEPVYRRAKGQS